MPSRDARLVFDISGEFAPVDGYGLKYFWDWKAKPNNEARRLEIYEDAFGGSAVEKRIQRLSYIWGNLGQEPTDTFIGSKLVFDIIGFNDDFQEFLTGDNRKFRVEYKHGTDVIFKGYVNTDRLLVQEKQGPFPMTFEAIDGIKSFESFRFIPQITAGSLGVLSPIGVLLGALNQTFVDSRKVNIACDIYEDGMNNLNSLFTEFIVPFSAIYTDGEIAKFVDGERIVNETLFISEVVTRLVNPFLCNVFLWKNDWYVISIPELTKTSRRFFKFLTDGSLDETVTVTDTFELLCPVNSAWDGFANAQRESRLVYNEFTSILNLGVLDNSSKGGIFESPFDIDDFVIMTTATTTAGALRLRSWWSYVNVIPTVDNIIGSTNFNESEAIYVDESGGGHLRIYKTTKPTGLADADISYIEASTASTGIEIGVVQEGANTIDFQIEYMIKGFITQPTNANGQFVGIMIRIGNNWLSYDDSDNTFDWELSENIMLFPSANYESFNTLRIANVVVPETANVVIRLYQTINTVNAAGSAQRNYSVSYRNLKFTVSETEGLANSSIAYKSITDSQYNRVYPDYDTWIGDALTANSLSAIKLLNDEASESWTDANNTSKPLQAIQVQTLANLYGRKNLRIFGKFYGGIPDPTMPIEYDGLIWKVTYFNHNSVENITEVELFQIETELS